MIPSLASRARCWSALAVTALALGCDAVTVQAPLVVSVEVVPASVTLAVGESRQLQAVVRDEDGSPLSASSIDWSSTAPGVAAVSASGTVSGIAVGAATIQARVGGVTGSAQVTVSSAAGFQVDSSSVAFTAAVGGSTSGPKAVVISATGAVQANGLQAAVGYDAGQPAGWLTAGLSSTTTPALLTLTANGGSLPPGDYGASVEISAPGYAPTGVRVTLSVRGSATQIQLDRTAVGFQAVRGGAVPVPQTVQVTNGGSGTLSGLTTSIDFGTGPSGWLSARLGATTAPTALTLTANQSGLAAGTYRATVRVEAAGAANSPQTVDVTFSVTTAGGAPQIGLSADSVTFAWSVGTSTPSPQNVSVTNLGGGTLSGLQTAVSYAPGQPTGWLVASLASAAAPTTLQLSVVPGALGAGVYEASVEVVAGVASNSPQFLRVRFTITSGPLIALSTDTLSFSAIQGAGNPTARTVSVSNAGTGTLSGLSVPVSYTPGQPTGWLSASLSGTSAPTTVTVSAATGSLPAGTYTATVNVTAAGANNSPQPVTVTFIVLTPAPSISLNPTSVSFAGVAGLANPAAQTVSVTNGGGQPLTGLAVGSITYGSGASGWLAASLSGTTAPATLTLTPNTAGLAAGTYTATVPVTSPVALTRSVSVTLTLAAPPTIGVSLPALTFNGTQGSANPPSQSVSITNTGGSTLDGLSTSISYASTSGWLTASLSGTAAPATLTVTAALGSLPAGTYNATINVASTAAGVTNSPQAIAVAFVVTQPPPAIGLSPSSLTFSHTQNSGQPAAQTVNVTNTVPGSTPLSGLTLGTVNYGSGANGWLDVTLNGTTAPTTITVQPNTSGLTAGTYTASFTVSSTAATNSPQTVSVSYVVANPPSIVLSTSTPLEFQALEGGASPASQTVAVTNGGGGQLTGLSTSVSYGAGQPTGWLSAPVAPTTAPATITLSATTGALSAGTYNATVSVSSTAPGVTNSPQVIAVTFVVSPPPPAIGLSTGSLSFSTPQNTGIPAQKTVSITNTGGQTLSGLAASVSYQQGSGWLKAPVLTSSTAPADLQVQPSTDALPPGTYNATISVTAPGASNSPQTVAVQYTVTAPPSIALSRTSVSFAAIQGGSNPADETVSVTNGGTGTLNGLSVSGGATWLTASISPTTAPATVTLKADVGGLTPGTYNATVQVASTATGVTNSPRTINVAFTVTPPPTIVISKGASQITVQQGQSGSDQVSITELNGNPMPGITTSVTYVTGGGWLNPVLSSTSAPSTLTLNVSSGSLAPGSYAATVFIEVAGATNTPRDVQVVMVVEPPPTIAVSDISKTFTDAVGTGSHTQTIDITNSGAGGVNGLSGLSANISYTGGGATGWLSTSLTSTTSPSTLSLTVDTNVAGLAAGTTYTANVVIASTTPGAAPVTVLVTFTP
ncbi:MAG: choice-of-anchor D domain-containing protein [Gemmatimonadota bacterium]